MRNSPICLVVTCLTIACTGGTTVPSEPGPPYPVDGRGIPLAADTIAGPVSDASPWSDLFGTPAGDQGLGIDLGPEGDLYLCGATGGPLVPRAHKGSADLFVQRRSQQGEVRWTRQFGSAGRDQAMAVSVAEDGTVFVGGMTTGALFGAEPVLVDGYVLALSDLGNPLWSSRLGPGSVNRVRAGPDGGVYVVGNFDAGGDYDGFVAFVTPKGEAWRTTFASSGFDAATDVRWDHDGIYVSGFASGSISGQRGLGDTDGFVARVDSNGRLRWLRVLGSGAWDALTRLSLHGDGLVVAGYTAGETVPGRAMGDNDLLVARYTKRGYPSWVRQWGTSGSEAAYGIGQLSGDRLALVGRIDGDAWPGFQQAGNGDAFLVVLDAQGYVEHAQQQGSTEVDEFQDLVTTADGSLFVTGYSASAGAGSARGGEDDAWVVRL